VGRGVPPSWAAVGGMTGWLKVAASASVNLREAWTWYSSNTRLPSAVLCVRTTNHPAWASSRNALPTVSRCHPCILASDAAETAHDRQPNTSGFPRTPCGGSATVGTVAHGPTHCRHGTSSMTWRTLTPGLTSAKPKRSAAALDQPRTLPAMAYKRAHRSGVEDKWHRGGTGTPCTNPKHGKPGTLVQSAKHGDGKRWRARFVNPSGREVEQSFHVKAEATAWITAQTADIAKGAYVAPKDAVMTFDAWAERWLATYTKSRRASSARQAKTHLKTIREEFGPMTLAEIKPSMVIAWTGKLNDDYSPSTVYALYRRLAHVLDDAIHDGLLARNPCSRRTAPPVGHVEQYCPTTEEVWALHDAMPEHLQVAVLLGRVRGPACVGGRGVACRGRGLHTRHRAPESVVVPR
jgi:hypothetical protein